MTSSRPKLGLIGIVNEEAKQDFWGTMQRVAEIGYEGIEGGGELLRGDVEANAARFRELGLQVATHSVNKEQLRDGKELDKVIREALALRTKDVTFWWDVADSREQLLRDAELYDATGARLKSEGLRFCYHNHAHEFQRVFKGVYALDILAEHTDPSHLYFRLDVAWITIGGADPAHILRKMAGRVPAIHLKDVYGTDEVGKWTAVGTGVVKIEESIEAAREIGVEWMTVEQDQLRNLTGLETATVSYLNLKERGLL
ncbi:sugar phosphate isomerase/epimerase family protein [Paenibacillus sacheonensis]|uniref:TIM barrel protein n=1 Tax=Paenibacillus sacheonensis TaxID=742054 RepID=A0A7X4YJM8_9BACL|nr:sugar phosphate isomerase/epimerase [Paenibacillus sacheonensis]MBM7564052.1 sugar phosphate isomerase/epimerase [Paenibacillus sacheonensis]NBC67616.1 TIM barrel protein [Paenibacillus sacheonensis]